MVLVIFFFIELKRLKMKASSSYIKEALEQSRMLDVKRQTNIITIA